MYIDVSKINFAFNIENLFLKFVLLSKILKNAGCEEV